MIIVRTNNEYDVRKIQWHATELLTSLPPVTRQNTFDTFGTMRKFDDRKKCNFAQIKNYYLVSRTYQSSSNEWEENGRVLYQKSSSQNCVGCDDKS